MRGHINSEKGSADKGNQEKHKKDCQRERLIPRCRELAYVTNTGTEDNPGNTVSVIDTEIDRVITTITVGSAPLGVAITPNGKRVYVTNQNDNCVSVIDTEVNRVIKTISVGSNPIYAAVTPDGTRVYISNFIDNTISVIDTQTNLVTDTIPAGNTPLGEVVGNTPFGTRNYVSNFQDNAVSVIDANPDSSLYNTIILTVLVGAGPVDIAMTSDGTTVYVTNVNDNTVSAIDTGTNSVTSIPVGARPSGVGVGDTAFGLRAYVTNEEGDIISIIDADPNSPSFNKVVDTISKNVGNSPSDASFTANGRKAYVPNNLDNTVSVIDTSTNKVVNTIKVGIFPNLAAIGRVCRLLPPH